MGTDHAEVLNNFVVRLLKKISGATYGEHDSGREMWPRESFAHDQQAGARHSARRSNAMKNNEQIYNVGSGANLSQPFPA
jgi:hypothetical protein